MGKTSKTIGLLLVLAGSLAAAGCRDAAPADPVPPHETFTLESQAVGETRVVCVWTPPSYAQSDAAYPVLYMPDGGVREDFPHIANTIADLMARGDIV